MYYINAIASITHQDTFEKEGFCTDLKPLNAGSELIKPDYKKYIQGSALRRMSSIIRMSLACASSCMEQVEGKLSDAIIVGTGLGCLTDTQKFLDTAITIEGLLPPTSFIQSTHNTIAGQISLHLQNNGYNITHSQNVLSFEMALQDAMLCLDEGMQTVLLGAADENIPLFNELVSNQPYPFTSGATFLVLSKTKTEKTIAKITQCDVRFSELMQAVYSDNQIDTVVFSSAWNNENSLLDFGRSTQINTNELVGVYPTNSAFSLHLAADCITSGKANKVLVVNALQSKKSSRILIESVE